MGESHKLHLKSSILFHPLNPSLFSKNHLDFDLWVWNLRPIKCPGAKLGRCPSTTGKGHFSFVVGSVMKMPLILSADSANRSHNNCVF